MFTWVLKPFLKIMKKISIIEIINTWRKNKMKKKPTIILPGGWNVSIPGIQEESVIVWYTCNIFIFQYQGWRHLLIRFTRNNWQVGAMFSGNSWCSSNDLFRYGGRRHSVAKCFNGKKEGYQNIPGQESIQKKRGYISTFSRPLFSYIHDYVNFNN